MHGYRQRPPSPRSPRDPTTITAGGSSTLSWSGITNASACSINNGVGTVSCGNAARASAQRRPPLLHPPRTGAWGQCHDDRGCDGQCRLPTIGSSHGEPHGGHRRELLGAVVERHHQRDELCDQQRRRRGVLRERHDECQPRIEHHLHAHRDRDGGSATATASVRDAARFADVHLYRRGTRRSPCRPV